MANATEREADKAIFAAYKLATEIYERYAPTANADELVRIRVAWALSHEAATAALEYRLRSNTAVIQDAAQKLKVANKAVEKEIKSTKKLSEFLDSIEAMANLAISVLRLALPVR